MDRKTIKVGSGLYEEMNEERKDLELTWDQYLQAIDGKAVMAPGKDYPIVVVVRGEVEADLSRLKDSEPVDYDRIREIVREETRAAIGEARR